MATSWTDSEFASVATALRYPSARDNQIIAGFPFDLLRQAWLLDAVLQRLDGASKGNVLVLAGRNGTAESDKWTSGQKFPEVSKVGDISRDLAKGVSIRSGIVEEMQLKVGKNVKLPEGFTITWGGEFENQERAMKRLGMIIPVSILLIFVLLFEAFGSARSAFLILLNVPFALIGGILALLLTGIHLSVSAAIGFIALFGQAVLNGVVMVSDFNERRAAGQPLFEAVKEGAMVRLRTVSMTSLLAMLGLLPMALSHGIGSEVQKPLAIVIIGGLVSATTLTLFLLPVIYLTVEGRAEKSEEARKRSEEFL